jgi:hypothetical protein
VSMGENRGRRRLAADCSDHEGGHGPGRVVPCVFASSADFPVIVAAGSSAKGLPSRSSAGSLQLSSSSPVQASSSSVVAGPAGVDAAPVGVLAPASEKVVAKAASEKASVAGGPFAVPPIPPFGARG